ncbi:hypothetical protein D3C72_2534210 [compost metagenome]
MGLEVGGQLVDAGGQDSDLHFGAAGVVGGAGVVGNNGCLDGFFDHVGFLGVTCVPPQPAGL